MSSITLLTDIGRALLASYAAAGQPYASAKIAVGDGNGAGYVPNVAQTSLVHEVWRGAATVALADGRAVFEVTIPAEVGGFTIRECAVLLGAVGAEELFIISQHPTHEKLAAPTNGAGPHTVAIPLDVSESQIGAFPISMSDNSVLALSRAPHISVNELVAAPPSSPVDGAMVAIDTGATGLFSGKSGYLAERVAGAWLFDLPPERSIIRVPDGAWYERVGSDWVALTFGTADWSALSGKPATFPASPHGHAIGDVTGLQTALDAKALTAHTHPQSEVTNLVADLAAKLPTSGAASFNGVTFGVVASNYASLTAERIILNVDGAASEVQLGRTSGNRSYFGYGAADVTYIRAGGAVNIGDSGGTGVNIGRAGVDTTFNGPIRLNTNVGLVTGGSYGSANHVLASGGNNTHPTWQNVNSLIDTASLFPAGRPFAFCTGPAPGSVGGAFTGDDLACAVTRVADIGLDTIIRVTFDVARANATYLVNGVCNSTGVIPTIVTKTASYCDINIGPDADTGGPSPQRFNLEFLEV